MAAKILFYKLAGNDPEFHPRFGGYQDWFERVLGPGRLQVYEAFRPVAEVGPRPRPEDHAGVVISGSPSSLVRREPWMDEVADGVRRAADAGVPVLGVCFGHQLIAEAWGGQVTENPRGWEIGTVELELSEAGARDPLFAGLGPRILVNQTHQDHVHQAPDAAVRLAANAHTPTQALAIGDHVRSVQFHPELTGAIVRAYIQKRHALLAADVTRLGRPAHDHPHARHETSHDTPQGETVLRNFDLHFVSKA